MSLCLLARFYIIAIIFVNNVKAKVLLFNKQIKVSEFFVSKGV